MKLWTMTLPPRLPLPERPATLAQEFVAEYYPSLAARGGGSSFSLVAEAWWNFGTIIGSTLAGLLLGALLMWCTSTAACHPHGLVQRLLPYLTLLCLLLHRGQAQAIFKQVGSLVLPVLVLVLLARAVWTVLRARPASAPRRVTARREEHLELGVH